MSLERAATTGGTETSTLGRMGDDHAPMSPDNPTSSEQRTGCIGRDVLSLPLSPPRAPSTGKGSSS